LFFFPSRESKQVTASHTISLHRRSSPSQEDLDTNNNLSPALTCTKIGGRLPTAAAQGTHGCVAGGSHATAIGGR